jgi:hypothetical protein
MIKQVQAEQFLKEIEQIIVLTGILGGLFVFLITGNLIYSLSLLFGVIVGYLNFRSTKNDGIKTLYQVRYGLAPQKGVVLYLSKFYMRLFATGILLFLFIKFLKFHPVFILGGIVLVYLQVVLIGILKLKIGGIEIA